MNQPTIGANWYNYIYTKVRCMIFLTFISLSMQIAEKVRRTHRNVVKKAWAFVLSFYITLRTTETILMGA